jgi:hypothetical protein
MEKTIIYKATKNCEYCDMPITVHWRSDTPELLDTAPQLKKSCMDIAMNEHWYDAHHICARCGQLIKTKNGETTFALKSSIDWPIHAEYSRINAKKSHYGALNVHTRCV